MQLPQPLVITLTRDEPPPAAEPSWTDATKHLRDVARWITGGVVATAAAVATGSSLTRLGSLDPLDDGGRLGLAAGGLLIALGAIGFLMKKSLGVLNIEAGTIVEVGNATVWLPLFGVKTKIERDFDFVGRGITWEAMLAGEDFGDLRNAEVVDRIDKSIPYYYVREKFDALSGALPWCTFVAFAALVVFAWAANPSDRKPASKPPLLQINLP